MSDQVTISLRYMVQMNRCHYEPYSAVIPKDVKPSDKGVIKEAGPLSNGGQTIKLKNVGFQFCIPYLEEDQPLAKEGDTVELFCKGYGYNVDGIRLNGKVIFYKTPEQVIINAQRMKEDYKASEQRRYDTFVPNPDWIHEFSFVSKEKQDLYKQSLEKNSKEGYGYGTYAFLSQWAERMEQMMQDGKPVADVAKQARDNVLKEIDLTIGGLTGAMYGFSVSILAECWKHGEELRRWHNLKTQIKNEGVEANETGGTLNPAMFSVG